jgi:hypothetical protein
MSIPRVLILYPKEFACFPKFNRKLGNILSRLDAFYALHGGDPRGFIEKMLGSSQACLGISRVERIDSVTHAIVFDDGEEFPDQCEALRERRLPVRLVRIKITRVINIKRETHYANLRSTPDYEYIGRGSEWGNPYSMFDAASEEVDDRSEVIRKFGYDFDRGNLRKGKADALQLAGKRLGCFCKPEACHGDIIAEHLNSYDDGT